MQTSLETSIVLKTFPFQERDRIVVFLTENQGKFTGIAKGGIGSKRFAGALDFLACSKILFVSKTTSEMVRIEEAHSHYEFKNLPTEYEMLSSASLASELILKIIEPGFESRDLFVILSQFLFQIDGGMNVRQALNAFLVKFYRTMGYPPSFLRCTSCAKPSHEVVKAFWSKSVAGMVCQECSSSLDVEVLSAELLLYFSELSLKGFQEIRATVNSDSRIFDQQLFRHLVDFLRVQVPGLPAEGLKSLKQLDRS